MLGSTSDVSRLLKLDILSYSCNTTFLFKIRTRALKIKSHNRTVFDKFKLGSAKLMKNNACLMCIKFETVTRKSSLTAQTDVCWLTKKHVLYQGLTCH